jgi:hypothetical protein
MLHEPTRDRESAGIDRRRPPSVIARKSGGPEPSGAGALRQRVGNRQMQRLMGETPARTPGATPQRAPLIQAKLTISQAGDAHEREADRMADAVMRMPSPGIRQLPAGGQASRAESEEERDRKTGPLLQRKEQTAGAPLVTPAVAAGVQALRGGGSALPGAERAFFEPRFGADFSGVRVHTDTRAADTAQAIDAKAFTVGRDIAFAPGQYAPDSPAGRHLLAHELTHVVQQEGAQEGPHERVQRWEGLEHKKAGNRAQNEFPYRGAILTDMTALRTTAGKVPGAPHDNTRADLLKGATVLVLAKERGWLQVLVESGSARDKKGSVVPAATLTGYVSHELVTKSGAVFDAELPVGGGLVLSYGDLVAFGGDHFKDLNQLGGEAASPAGRARLKKLRDLTDSEGKSSPAYEDAATISKEYAERYKNLALENVSHFSRGGTALVAWQQIHRTAVVAALEAGKKGDSVGLARAYAANAFGDHFLTDSFSSGHVRTPREQAIDYYKKLAHAVFEHIIDHVSEQLGNRIFELLLQDYVRARVFGDEGDRRAAIARVRGQVMQSITDAGGPAKVQEQFGLYVAGAFSKIMHDRENAQGLDVVSKAHPEGWTALGDASLETPANAKNLAYMTEAVQASKQDLLTAFRIGAGVLGKYGKAPPQAAIDASLDELTRKVGPPFAALAFAPSPAAGAKPLPGWEWGKLDPSMKAELAKMIARYLTTTAQADLLAKFPLRQEVEVRGPNVDARPRDAARDILNAFLADPVPFLEAAFGRAAGP